MKFVPKKPDYITTISDWGGGEEARGSVDG
jgi:hypothetical protein